MTLPPRLRTGPGRQSAARLALVLAAAAAPLALAAAASSAPRDPIDLGYWETQSKVTSPLPMNHTDHKCVRHDDVQRFLNGQVNHIYNRCTYPVNEIMDGKIVRRGECQDKHGDKVGVSSVLTYTRTTIHLTANVSYSLGGIPLKAKVVSDGQRIGECPPGAK
jgi:hypothetical protein